MKRLLIYGARHLDVIKLIDAINRTQPTFEVVGFVTDSPEEQGRVLMSYPVLGGRAMLSRWAQDRDVVFCSNITSSLRNRRKIGALLEENRCEVVSLVHPLVDMTYVTCGSGAIIPEGCVVGGNVTIGRHFTCRLKSVISHNVTIGDFVFVGAGVTCCGHSVLGDGCFVGAGTTLSAGVKIGAGAVVGAGSVVLEDIPSGVLAYGVPAKVKRAFREDETVG
ncbi:MAG: epsM 1 [Deltaproteobacteria bacterium]|jgi:sugar O-acyltransferase (sialic acid O-acetyltransferase NeuD family)|nr:epsM 1 [Deltaproteobacteria bacterium]